MRLLLLIVLTFSICSVNAQEQDRVLSFIKAEDVLALGEQQKLQLQFSRPLSKERVVVTWTDSKGRVCEQVEQTVENKTTTMSVVLKIKHPIGYHHNVSVAINDVEQRVNKSFIIEYPYPKVWKDYQATVWAHYDKAYGALMRDAGLNASIWNGQAASDHDFKMYPDNILYESFAYYHKRRIEHVAMKDVWEKNLHRRQMHHRRPSLTDPGTFEKIRDRLQPVVERVKPYRPLFYNLADEIGIADQSAVSDMDWEYSSRTAWRNWLQEKYGDLNALNKQWDTQYAKWSDVRAFFPSTHTLYDQLWAEHLLPLSFKDISAFQKYFNTQHQTFKSFVDAYSAVKGDVSEDGLKKRFSNKVDAFNQHFQSQVTDFTAAEQFIAHWEAWVTQRDASNTQNWNLSWWCDWREYMDHYMAHALGKARRMGQEYDAQGIFGITGTHHPGVFSGHDYARLIQYVDMIVPYDIGQSFELLRGLDPDYLYMHATWQTEDKYRRDLWTYFLGGCRGVIIWDNHEKRNRLINRADFTLTTRGKSGAATLKEICNGLDQLLLQSQREDYGVAIYHSMKSIKINWIHQYISLGRQWIKRMSWHEFRECERSVLRTSWIKLIEDVGLQFLFVSPEQLLNDRLQKERVRVLILPEVWALSEDEANKIKAFAASGGLVIADQFTGLFDGFGKRRSSGVLDQAMGIDQSGVLGDERFQKQALQDVRKNSYDTRKRSNANKVLKTSATAVEEGRLFEADYGEGAFVFLNCDLSHYSRIRMFKEHEQQRERIVSLIDKYVKPYTQPFARVLNAQTQERQQGVETALWHVGKQRKMLSFIRNIQTRKEGIGGESFVDNALFEQEEAITVRLPKPYYVINQRTGESLGQTQEFTHQLKPFEASLFSLAEQEPQTMTPQAPALVKRGDLLRIQISDALEKGAADAYVRCVYVQAKNPSGEEVWYYCKDLSAHRANLDYEIPIALNEALGTWSFVVTDIFSKQQRVVEIEIIE